MRTITFNELRKIKDSLPSGSGVVIRQPFRVQRAVSPPFSRTRT